MVKKKDSGIEWICEIPEDWEISKNKYVMEKIKEIREFWKGEAVLSLTVNGVIKRDLDNPSGKMPTTFNGYQFIRPNNLLMCLFDIDVTPRCIGLIKIEGVCSPAYSQFKLINKNANANYIYYYYLNLDFTKELLHLSKNLRHSLGEDDFGQIPMILPPLNTQNKIADFLDEKCSKINSLKNDIEKQIETLEQYKKSVITEAVTKGIKTDVKMKDSGIKWIDKIPEHWEIHPIYYYFEERKHKNSLCKEQNLLSLSYGNVIRKDINALGGLLPESFNTYNIIEKDDIVIRPTDLQNDKRSLRTGLCKEHGIITSAYITLMPKKNVNSQYFHYLLHSYDIEKVFYNMGNGVRQGLNYSEFKKLLVISPTSEEQKNIVNYLDSKCSSIDNIITSKKQQLEKLEEYKKSLIFEYVTGKKEC